MLEASTLLPYHFQIKDTSTVLFFFSNVNKYSEEIPDLVSSD